jgi:hypothetical protein
MTTVSSLCLCWISQDWIAASRLGVRDKIVIMKNQPYATLTPGSGTQIKALIRHFVKTSTLPAALTRNAEEW